MQAMLARLSDIILLRYLLASVGALAVDVAVFQGAMLAGVPPAIAAAIGYCVGILAHWLLSSRAVFTGRVAERGVERTKQKALFVGSALAGLAATTAIVAGFDAFEASPMIGKLVAIMVSFALTWALRNRVVFRASA